MIGLFWLAEGTNPIGSESDARIRLPAGRGAEELGSVFVADGVAAFLGPGGMTRLAADGGAERPFLEVGGLSLSLIARGGRSAVRVRDRGAAARSPLPRIDAFPPDPSWRIEARFELHDPPRTRAVANVVGGFDVEISPGVLAFDRDGSEHRLEAVAELGETDYWIVFGDATNGRETYGGGRFVYAPRPVNGRTIVDFNKAYNPPCVFTAYSTCPLPDPQNRLPFRVEAGEKDLRS